MDGQQAAQSALCIEQEMCCEVWCGAVWCAVLCCVLLCGVLCCTVSGKNVRALLCFFLSWRTFVVFFLGAAAAATATGLVKWSASIQRPAWMVCTGTSCQPCKKRGDWWGLLS